MSEREWIVEFLVDLAETGTTEERVQEAKNVAFHIEMMIDSIVERRLREHLRDDHD